MTFTGVLAVKEGNVFTELKARSIVFACAIAAWALCATALVIAGFATAGASVTDGVGVGVAVGVGTITGAGVDVGCGVTSLVGVGEGVEAGVGCERMWWIGGVAGAPTLNVNVALALFAGFAPSTTITV